MSGATVASTCFPRSRLGGADWFAGRSEAQPRATSSLLAAQPEAESRLEPPTSSTAEALDFSTVDSADPMEGESRRRTLPKRGGSMAWNLEGTYFETCSCDVVCPCTASLALGADYDRCRVTLVFNVTKGEVEGTDVGGLTIAAIADTPKVMSEGNWRLGVFVDAAASDAQAEKLGAVFGGQLGGPMEALGPLISENLGVERAAIEIREEGLRHSVKIGDSIDFEIEDVVSFGVESGEPARMSGIFHPAGSELTISKATRSSINAFGIEYEGKSGFSSSRFAWAA